MVESQPSKLLVAGSIPVSRSNPRLLQECGGWDARRSDATKTSGRANGAECGEAVTIPKPASR